MAKVEVAVKSIRKFKNFEDAYTYLQKLPSERKTKDVYKAITEKSKTIEDIELIIKDMDNYKVPINDKIFRSFLTRMKDDSQVLNLLNLIDYYQKSFNEFTKRDLLQKLKEVQNIERVFSLLKDDVEVNLFIYEKLIYKSTCFKEIIPYLNKMKDYGVQLTDNTCKTVIEKIEYFSDGLSFAYTMKEGYKPKLREKVCLKLITLASSIEELDELINLFQKELEKPSISNDYFSTRQKFEKMIEEEYKEDQLEQKPFLPNSLPVTDIFEFKKVSITELKERYSALYDKTEEFSNQPYFIKGDEPLHEHINFLANEINAKSINIATGFLYKSGIGRIIRTFQSVFKHQGEINILAGNLQKYPASLKTDIKLKMMDEGTAKYLNNCMLNYPIHLKTIENRFFHGKFYLFEGDSKAFVMIGSSNISGSGFCANYEVNLLYILDVNSELFKSFKEDFKVIWESGTTIEELNLEKFSDMNTDFEYDQLSNTPEPYDELDDGWFNADDNTPDIEKVDDDNGNKPGSGGGIRLDDLPNEEIKRRFQYWDSKRPTSILKDLNLPEFDGYILFEYKDHELLVLESFDPDKALYCFKNQGTFEELKNKLLPLKKEDIQKRKDEFGLTRKYHKIDKVTIDDEIETLFVKKSDYTLI